MSIKYSLIVANLPKAYEDTSKYSKDSTLLSSLRSASDIDQPLGML